MGFTRTILVAAPLLIAASFGVGAGPAKRDSQEVESHITKLSSNDWQTREQAREALARIGAPAVPHLEPIAKDAADPDLRSAAAAVIQGIAEAKLVGASLVTMHATSAHPAQIFAELFRQARAPDAYDNDPPGLLDDASLPRIDVAFDRVPFWAAIGDVCERSRLNVRSVWDPWSYTIIADHAPPFAKKGAPRVMEGPYVLTFELVNVSSDKKSPHRDYAFNLAIMPEPKIKLAEGSLHIDSLTDQNSAEIPACNMGLPNDGPHRWQATQARLGWHGEARWYVNLGFRPPPTSTHFTFRGRLNMSVVTEFETVEIADVMQAKEVTREAAGRRFTLHKVTPGPDPYVAELTLYRDQLSPADWRTFRDLMRRVQLLDSRGQPLNRSGGSSRTKAGEATFRHEYRRTRPVANREFGEPVRFVWKIPKAIKAVEVPFVFADIPLDPEEIDRK